MEGGVDFGLKLGEVLFFEEGVFGFVTPLVEGGFEIGEGLLVGGFVGKIGEFVGVVFEVVEFKLGWFFHALICGAHGFGGGRDDRGEGGKEFLESELVAGIDRVGKEVVDELEAVVTDGALGEEIVGGVEVVFGKEVGAPLRLGIFEDGKEIESGEVGDGFGLGGGEESWEEVEGGDEVGASGIGGHLSGPGDDEGDAGATFV